MPPKILKILNLL